MSIIVPPGKPTIIVRGQPQTITVGRQINRGVVTTEPGKQVVRPCDPHPVEVLEPVAQVIKVVTKGPQGEEGPPGPPGPAGGNAVQVQAVGTIGGSRVVRSVPGGVGYASSANPLHGDDVLGITLQAGTDEPINVQVAGEVTEPSWDWAPQEPVFLSIDGLMTQVPPEDPTDAFILVIGFATSPTSIMLRIEPPIYF